MDSDHFVDETFADLVEEGRVDGLLIASARPDPTYVGRYVDASLVSSSSPSWSRAGQHRFDMVLCNVG